MKSKGKISHLSSNKVMFDLLAESWSQMAQTIAQLYKFMDDDEQEYWSRIEEKVPSLGLNLENASWDMDDLPSLCNEKMANELIAFLESSEAPWARTTPNPYGKIVADLKEMIDTKDDATARMIAQNNNDNMLWCLENAMVAARVREQIEVRVNEVDISEARKRLYFDMRIKLRNMNILRMDHATDAMHILFGDDWDTYKKKMGVLGDSDISKPVLTVLQEMAKRFVVFYKGGLASYGRLLMDMLSEADGVLNTASFSGVLDNVKSDAVPAASRFAQAMENNEFTKDQFEKAMILERILGIVNMISLLVDGNDINNELKTAVFTIQAASELLPEPANELQALARKKGLEQNPELHAFAKFLFTNERGIPGVSPLFEVMPVLSIEVGTLFFSGCVGTLIYAAKKDGLVMDLQVGEPPELMQTRTQIGAGPARGGGNRWTPPSFFNWIATFYRFIPALIVIGFYSWFSYELNLQFSRETTAEDLKDTYYNMYRIMLGPTLAFGSNMITGFVVLSGVSSVKKFLLSDIPQSLVIGGYLYSAYFGTTVADGLLQPIVNILGQDWVSTIAIFGFTAAVSFATYGVRSTQMTSTPQRGYVAQAIFWGSLVPAVTVLIFDLYYALQGKDESNSLGSDAFVRVFLQRFKPEKFSAEEWVAIVNELRDSGIINVIQRTTGNLGWVIWPVAFAVPGSAFVANYVIADTSQRNAARVEAAALEEAASEAPSEAPVVPSNLQNPVINLYAETINFINRASRSLAPDRAGPSGSPPSDRSISSTEETRVIRSRQRSRSPPAPSPFRQPSVFDVSSSDTRTPPPDDVFDEPVSRFATPAEFLNAAMESVRRSLSPLATGIASTAAYVAGSLPLGDKGKEEVDDPGELIDPYDNILTDEDDDELETDFFSAFISADVDKVEPEIVLTSNITKSMPVLAAIRIALQLYNELPEELFTEDQAPDIELSSDRAIFGLMTPITTRLVRGLDAGRLRSATDPRVPSL